MEGHTIPKVSKLLNCSESFVRKIANFYVSNGELERLNKYNATFQRPITKPHTPIASGSNPHTPILPARAGGIFAISKQPKNIQRNLRGFAYDIEKNFYKAQWGRYKCQIWLQGGFLRGQTPTETLANAREMLLAVAAKLELKHEAKLALIRWTEPEWVDFDQSRSKRIANSAGIARGGVIEVAGALHKFSDFSHPDKFQINPIKGGKQGLTTEHAEAHHYVYSGALARDMQAMAGTIRSLADAMEAIKIRMDLEARK